MTDNFEVGDILVGKVNGCRLEVLEFQTIELMDLRVQVQVKFKNLDTNEPYYAPLTRIKNSAFEVIKGGNKQ